MAKLTYSRKSKCQGCQALQCTKTSYSCEFGIPIDFREVDGKLLSPKPGGDKKCFKPKNTADLREVRKRMIGK